jgi:hypothetical protein
MGLLLHCGGKHASLYELQQIELPAETDTYKPVSHYDLALNLADVAGGLLNGYTLSKSQFGLARGGNQMFGVHTFQNGSASMGLSIGFRNSYDKSMSVGIAIGATVFVCDNLALTGDISLMRKHTTNVWEDLETMVVTTVYRSQYNFHHIVQDAEILSGFELSDNQAYQILGYLYGNGVITPRQIPIVKKEWLKPEYNDFADRNAWSFYNACTEALKTCPPRTIMEKHINLHKLMMKGAKDGRISLNAQL